MNLRLQMLLPLTIGLLLGTLTAQGQLTTERVASGLSRPVFVTHATGDFNRVFIIEQRQTSTARIRILNIPAHTLNGTAYLTISPTATGNEEGLLGLAFHPQFLANGYFWVYYTNSSGNNTIVRYRANAPYATSTTADAASATTVLTISHPGQSNHNGGWIAFSPNDSQGYLYVNTGDGGSGNDPPNNAQNINVLLGKTLRLDIDGADDIPGTDDDDGAIGQNLAPYTNPPDNPFVGVAGLDEIYFMGLRNPWRAGFDRANGDLYIGDVGQNAIEEIDFVHTNTAVTPIQNFGWRCMEGLNCTGLTGCTCNDPVLTDPIQTYSHAGGACSVTGGYVYRGCAIPALQGTYFYADYCSSVISSFVYDRSGNPAPAPTDRTAELDPPGALTIDSITSFGEDAFGEIYICDQSGGEVYKIIPASFVGPDCNGNGRNDACDLLAGTSVDCNSDGTLDDCQSDPTVQITADPANAGAEPGGTAVFSVSVSGDPPFTYQWRKGGVDLVDGGNISGATTDTLTISPVSVGDDGFYDVVVSNVCGSVESADARLVVGVCCPCDVNCDGSINGFDVDPMVVLLSGGGTPCSPCAGDANGDGSVNGFDVDPFVDMLGGGTPCSGC
ncbi:MAG: hypothetical protein CHACPFDD_02592 [Phycisphaerae bacterium]|nr:hypothetical protein [Phycisphaerae bacterium]